MKTRESGVSLSITFTHRPEDKRKKRQPAFPSAYTTATFPVQATHTPIYIQTRRNKNLDGASSSCPPSFQTIPRIANARLTVSIHLHRYCKILACRVRTTRHSLQISATLQTVHARTRMAVGRLNILYLSL